MVRAYGPDGSEKAFSQKRYKICIKSRHPTSTLFPFERKRFLCRWPVSRSRGAGN